MARKITLDILQNLVIVQVIFSPLARLVVEEVRQIGKLLDIPCIFSR